MGLLVGTALIVIIPEGVDALYTSAPSSRSESQSSRAVAHSPKTEKAKHYSAHAWIGPPLIAGLVLMFLVDKLQRSHPEPRSQPRHISMHDLSPRAEEPGEFLEGEGLIDGAPRSNSTGKRGIAMTTGLVIHSSADGIALGASSSAANTELSFIIFLAIMVHKGPAAFGLTSQLLKKGLSKRSIRAHLLVFSLAAPAGAIVTWLLAHFIGANFLQNAESTPWWTAILLLFSGGTFLYVAMDAMREVGEKSDHGMKGVENHGQVEDLPHSARGGKWDILAAVIGMLLPLALQTGHAH